jgi:hypothetical protein
MSKTEQDEKTHKRKMKKRGRKRRRKIVYKGIVYWGIVYNGRDCGCLHVLVGHFVGEHWHCDEVSLHTPLQTSKKPFELHIILVCVVDGSRAVERTGEPIQVQHWGVDDVGNDRIHPEQVAIQHASQAGKQGVVKPMDGESS